MRHGDKVNNLGRTSSHRQALMQNMSISLIEHKRINTTLPKAKALRRFLEPLVTKAKANTTHSRRIVFSRLQNKEAIKELFGPIADKIGERPGGYLRIIKLGFRPGDGAELAMIEFVDYNEVYNPNASKQTAKKKTRRSRAKAGAATVGAAAAAVTTAVVAEEVVETAEETAAEEVIDTAADAVADATTEEKAAE
jgi:large subunit ribosomal protein L17